MSNQTAYTDRTRTVTHQRCPRRRWWQYEFRHRGVEPMRVPLPLFTGRFTHEALDRLLTLAKNAGHQRPSREQVRQLLADIREEILAFCVERGIEIEEVENEFTVVDEQTALIEGMIWCYWHRGLQDLLDAYEILETETEDLHPLTPAGDLEVTRDPDLEVKWQSRADALLRSRITHGLVVLSWKTTKGWDMRKEGEGEVDMQGISEVWAIEQRLKEQVEGVLMIYLRKGERRKNDFTGQWVQYSPLIRAWVDKTGSAPTGMSAQDLTQAILSGTYDESAGKNYYWSWRWTDPETGKQRQLSYHKAEPYEVWKELVSDPQAIEKWVDRLASGEVQPEAGDCLGEQIIIPEIYRRRRLQQRSWYTSTAAQEVKIAEASREINKLLDEQKWELAEDMLDAHFPRHGHSCNYPARCPKLDICQNSPQLASQTDPIAQGDFVWRNPHHQPEVEAMLGGEE